MAGGYCSSYFILLQEVLMSNVDFFSIFRSPVKSVDTCMRMWLWNTPNIVCLLLAWIELFSQNGIDCMTMSKFIIIQ